MKWENTKLISWWSWTWFILIQRSVSVTIKPAIALHRKSNFNLAWRRYVFDSLVSGHRDLCSCSYKLLHVLPDGWHALFIHVKHIERISDMQQNTSTFVHTVFYCCFAISMFLFLFACESMLNVPRKWFTCSTNDQMVHTSTVSVLSFCAEYELTIGKTLFWFCS